MQEPVERAENREHTSKKAEATHNKKARSSRESREILPRNAGPRRWIASREPRAKILREDHKKDPTENQKPAPPPRAGEGLRRREARDKAPPRWGSGARIWG